jgi:hypothetical protein
MWHMVHMIMNGLEFFVFFFKIGHKINEQILHWHPNWIIIIIVILDLHVL